MTDTRFMWFAFVVWLACVLTPVAYVPVWGDFSLAIHRVPPTVALVFFIEWVKVDADE